MIHSMGGGEKGQPGAKGQDSEGDLHIINQLRKIVDMKLPMEVKFLDKSYRLVEVRVAEKCLEVYNDLRTSIEKEALTQKLWQDSVAISKVSEIFAMINSNNNKKKEIYSHGTMGFNRRSI